MKDAPSTYTTSVIMRSMMNQSTNKPTPTKPVRDKPTLGILTCGHSPQKIVEQHGLYESLFENLLGPETFNYQSYAVVDGVLPASVNDADAWLITGSKHGTYEPLPWIAPLEDFIREAFAIKAPMVGICFGHQILAQALGGKVEKFSGGWIVGTHEYQLDALASLNSENGGGKNDDDTDVMNAWHQDQVVALPENARAIGSSENCQYAAIAYGDHAVSLQPHPEFENSYVESLLVERGSALPAESLQQASSSLGQNLTNKRVADWLVGVLGGSGR